MTATLDTAGNSGFRRVRPVGLDHSSAPRVLLVVLPVDGGATRIGVMECPWCGQDHYTADLSLGVRDVVCGPDESQRADGCSTVTVVGKVP